MEIEVKIIKSPTGKSDSTLPKLSSLTFSAQISFSSKSAVQSEMFQY